MINTGTDRFDQRGPLVPFSSVQLSPTRLRRPPSPLLEKEGNALRFALAQNVLHPGFVHRARSGSAFAADDHPVNSCEIDRAEGANQRLDGQKANGRSCLRDVLDTRKLGAVFDRSADPNIRRRRSLRVPRIHVTAKPRASLSQ